MKTGCSLSKTCTNTKASNHTNTAEILIFNQDQFARIQLLHCVDKMPVISVGF